MTVQTSERCVHCGEEIAYRSGKPEDGLGWSMETWRHVDGAMRCAGARTMAERQSRCAECGARGTITVRQLPYGNESTCSACGHSHYFSIGD